MTRFISIATAVLSSFTSFAFAQEDNDTNHGQCSTFYDPVAKGDFNSSGSLAFQFSNQDEWHLSLTLQDIRRPPRSYPASENVLSALISVPRSLVGSERGNDTRFCTYWMNGRNATVQENNNSTESCKGILSDKCQQALEEVDSISSDEYDCPSMDNEKIKKACDDDFVWLWNSKPLNFSDSSCALESIPGIDLPSDHLSFPALGAGIGQPYENDSSFSLYDLRVQQPVPVLISALVPVQGRSDLREAHRQVFCVAPSDLKEGSRVPEEGSMPGVASGLELKKTAGFAALIASFVVAALFF